MTRWPLASSMDGIRSTVRERVRWLRALGLLQEGLFLDGAWRAASDSTTQEVLDPGTGEVVGAVAVATVDDVMAAVSAADRALRDWVVTPATLRAEYLERWRDLVLEHIDPLGTLLTLEQGKPLAEARGEIEYSAAFIRFYAEEARRAYGQILPTDRGGRRLFVLRQPIGIVAAITPWNFPALMVARKLAPALAAGCTVVCKPASETPLTALAFAELAARAGFPPGVLNVVHGEPAVVGRVLTQATQVRMVTFTGSTEVGRLLMAQSASTVKRVALELGGNAPFIVFDDADLDAAAAGAVESKFRNAGQTCVCANRILVQESVHDAFVERIVAAMPRLAVGHGLDPNSAIGPLVNDSAVEKVLAHIEDATSRGATVLCGGTGHDLGGTFFTPTILVDARPDMQVARAETFGPVAPILRFSDEPEAIAMANATESGLAAYFYSQDVGRVLRVAEGLEFGVVGANTGTISYEGAPFGGVKQSGLGREGGHLGLEEFLESKYLCLDGVTRQEAKAKIV